MSLDEDWHADESRPTTQPTQLTYRSGVVRVTPVAQTDQWAGIDEDQRRAFSRATMNRRIALESSSLGVFRGRASGGVGWAAITALTVSTGFRSPATRSLASARIAARTTSEIFTPWPRSFFTSRWSSSESRTLRSIQGA